MKSSVTSRKQRFWALLLAVVMVVGLLPTAGVKAALVVYDEDTGAYNANSLAIGDILVDGSKIIRGSAMPGAYVFFPDNDRNRNENAELEESNAQPVEISGNYYVKNVSKTTGGEVTSITLDYAWVVYFDAGDYADDPDPMYFIPYDPEDEDPDLYSIAEAPELKNINEGVEFDYWKSPNGYRWIFDNETSEDFPECSFLFREYFGNGFEITFTAKWNISTLIEFLKADPESEDYDDICDEVDGGMESQPIYLDEATNLNACGYSRPGYRFAGWKALVGDEDSLEDEGVFSIFRNGNDLFEDEDVITIEGDNWDEDDVLYLYATWEQIKYTIEWDWNPEGWNPEGITKHASDYPDGLPAEFIPGVTEPIDLSKIYGTKEGYLFAGWEYLGNVTEDGSWNLIDDEHGKVINADTCEDFDSYSKEDIYDEEEGWYLGTDTTYQYSILLRAKWVPIFTINYHPYYEYYDNINFEGKISGEMPPQVIDTQDKLNGTLTPVVYTCNVPGFEFGTWDTVDDNGHYLAGDFYDQAKVTAVINSVEAAQQDNQETIYSVDLYAYWRTIDTEYIVEFDKNFDEDNLPEKVEAEIVAPGNKKVHLWGDEELVDGEDSVDDEGDDEGQLAGGDDDDPDDDDPDDDDPDDDDPDDDDPIEEEEPEAELGHLTYGTVTIPAAPSSIANDPIHYQFLGWQVGTGETATLYQPGDTPKVIDVLEVAGIDWKDGVVKTIQAKNEDGEDEGEELDPIRDPNWVAPTITFTAQWEPIKIDILFDANTAEYGITSEPANLDDKKIEGVPFDSTVPISYPEIKDVEGKYGVSGWKVKNEKEGSRNILKDDKVSDIVLKADEVGATEYAYIFTGIGEGVLIGDIIDNPNNPNNPSGENIGTVVDLQRELVGQVTLYAIWKKLHTVTFDYCYPKDYTPNKDVEKKEIFEGDRIEAPSPAPECEGYTFAGWYYDPNVEGLDLRKEAQAVRPNTYYAANPMPNDPAEGDEDEVDFEDLEEFDFDAVLYSDITLIAKWTPIDYTVEFEENGGELKEGEEMTPQGFVYDTAQELKANKYTRAGYTFGGWAETATGAKKYDDKKSVSNLTKVDNSTVTLYAVWTPNTYTVAFDKNDANATGTMTAQAFTYDAAQELTANAFTNPGYTFAGWAKTATGEVEYADKDPVENLTTVNNGSVTLYAVWTQSAVVTLKFYPDGGVINDDDSELGYYEVSGPEGIIIDAPGEEVVTKNGYIFAGWEDENEDVTYKPGDPINLYEGELYATWTPNSYVVVYDYYAPFESELNTKLADTWVMGLYDNENVFVPLYMNVDVDTAAYKFLGWSAKPKSTVAEFDKEPVTLKKVIDAAFAAGTLSDDDVATLYGVWEKQKYTVKFDLNGHGEGSLDVDQLTKDYYYYGDSVDEPASEPSDIGYDFKGWYCIEEGLEDDPTPWDFDEDTVEGNMTLQADWTPKNYDFVLVTAVEAVDAPAAIEGKSYEDNVKFPTLTDAKGEYTFVGWVLVLNEDSTAADFAAAQDIPVSTVVGKVSGEITNGKITLYALWTKKPTHQVRWLGDNDELLYEATVIDGNPEPEYGGKTPAKENYSFDEWEKVPNENGNDVIYKAKFTANTHKVIWLDDNGEPLYEVTVLDEDIEEPEYKGPTPTKENYDFDEWEPVEDENDVIYKAKFNPKKYGVKFIDDDNRLISETQYDYGTEAAKIVIPDDPTKAGYTFTGWTPAIADVTGNATYTATYEINKYTVTWKNEDGTVLETDKDVEYGTDPKYDGATPTKAADDTYTYTFKGWTPVLDKVTKDVTYTAEYSKVAKGNGGNANPNPPAPTYYTITWQNYDGTTLGTSQVEAGKVPTYTGATPSRASDDDFVYSFSTWTPNVVAATQNATYKAQYNASAIVKPTPTATPTPTPTPTPAAPQVYNIEYYEELEDGTVVQLKKTMNPDTYTYGVGAVIKYGIDKEGYKFNGWYSKRSKKYVDKVSETTKGTVKLYARFLPIDDGNGNGGDESAGTPDSEFGILCVRLTDYTEDSMTLMWDLMEGVDGYDIFGSRCNSKDVIRPYEPIDSVDANTDHYVANDLLKQTYYKFYVRAYILVNNEKRYITTSINVHGVTLNEKYGVADDIIVNKVVVKGKKSKTKYDSERDGYVEEINITMKVGQTLKIVASEYNADGKEIRAHRPISFESSKPDILKVGKKKNHKYGVEVKDKANTYKSHTIFANAAGECTIYVFAQNGLYTKVNVTVKAAK